MASLSEIEAIVRSLKEFTKSLEQEVDMLDGIYDPEIKVVLIKKIQSHIFSMALKMPFGMKGH